MVAAEGRKPPAAHSHPAKKEKKMAMIPHPITGLLMNEIELQHGHITDKERQTARHLLADGHARWVVAAMLGRFPLAFSGTRAKPADRRPKLGGGMTLRDAARDPRQISMVDVWEDLFDDLFGPGHAAVE
jgi:hypothetical protein